MPSGIADSDTGTRNSNVVEGHGCVNLLILLIANWGEITHNC